MAAYCIQVLPASTRWAGSSVRDECSANGMPRSCTDLWWIGHELSGLYLIMGKEKVETVYCDFSVLPSDPSFQKWIGFNDVKSQPVYFYVQRNSHFDTTGTPILFELAQLNIGNAMDLASGKFTAPRTGTYHFAYTELAYFVTSSSSRKYLYVGIYLNGNLIGSGQADEVSTAAQYDSVSLHSTLNLKMGDQIWLEIFYKSESFLSVGSHYNHFSGWLLDEDISHSLV